MVTKKAGCFLIRKESREVAVIYRKRQNDYSFPKGHVEEGETLKQTTARRQQSHRIPICVPTSVEQTRIPILATKPLQ